MAPRIDFEATALVSQLSEVESNIKEAVLNLEDAVTSANKRNRQIGSPEIPNPVKLVRRLTALEIALNHLKKDCAILSKRRLDLVKTIVTNQQQTVSTVNEMLESTQEDDPYSSRDEVEDEAWNSMTRSLEEQSSLI